MGATAVVAAVVFGVLRGVELKLPFVMPQAVSDWHLVPQRVCTPDVVGYSMAPPLKRTTHLPVARPSLLVSRRTEVVPWIVRLVAGNLQDTANPRGLFACRWLQSRHFDSRVAQGLAEKLK
jgi:hypothetical protein